MNTEKTVVIYHRADFDGIFCYQIAKKFLGTENVTYIGWDYSDPEPGKAHPWNLTTTILSPTQSPCSHWRCL
jgi:hypothetical protein